jgi:hypothetical protein
MVYFSFEAFRFMLALIALSAMLLEFIRNKELRYVFLAYFFLAVSAGVVALAGAGYFPAQDFFFHLFGISLGGLLFAKTAYSANKRINRIRTKTTKVFR